MDDPDCTVSCAQIEDTPALLRLEQKYFDSYWHSDQTLIQQLIKQEPMMFRVCKADDRVKGYYWVVPLQYEEWKQVLTGEMDEDEMMDHICSFTAEDIYLYICSVIVDQSDVRRKSYTRALVRDFARHFVQPKSEYARDINAIGAFTISEGVQRLMERSRFTYKGSFQAYQGKKVRAYATRRQNLIQQVREKRKKAV